MKKVLFATTALVLSAGFASAEVSLSGDGRMGVVYDGDYSNFSSRARVIFTLSGQTDGGLEFGGSFKTSNSYEAADGTDGSVYISGAFGKLEMGNVVSAPEALFADLPEVGYTDLVSADAKAVNDFLGVSNGIGSNDIPYLTLDNNTASALLYTYSAGAFSVAAAMSDGRYEDTSLLGGMFTFTDTQQYSVAANYTFGNYMVGLGYEGMDLGSGVQFSQTELAGTATFGNTALKAYYAKGGQDYWVDDAYGLGVTSVFGATTVLGYIQAVNMTDDFGGDEVTWWGLGASYDLGGGASIAAGVADNNMSGTDPVADLGVKFTF